MITKDKLKDIKICKLVYDMAVEKRVRLIERASSLSQQIKEISVNQGSHKNYIEEQFIKVAEVNEEVQKAKEDYEIKCNEVWEVIERMNNERLKLVLKLRYIDCLEWQEVAERMNLSLSYVYTLHGWALVDFIKVQEKKEG